MINRRSALVIAAGLSALALASCGKAPQTQASKDTITFSILERRGEPLRPRTLLVNIVPRSWVGGTIGHLADGLSVVAAIAVVVPSLKRGRQRLLGALQVAARGIVRLL